MKRFGQAIALVVLSSWFTLGVCASLTTVELKNLPERDVEARLVAEPYVSDYLYAARLFSAGKKDAAVFWFYVGQLRGRVYYTAHPTDLDGTEAFTSMTQVLGESINAHAGADPTKWAAILDKVLVWDASHDDTLTPKNEFARQRDEVRAGMKQLRESVLLQAHQSP